MLSSIINWITTTTYVSYISNKTCISIHYFSQKGIESSLASMPTSKNKTHKTAGMIKTKRLKTTKYISPTTIFISVFSPL